MCVFARRCGPEPSTTKAKLDYIHTYPLHCEFEKCVVHQEPTSITFEFLPTYAAELNAIPLS